MDDESCWNSPARRSPSEVLVLGPPRVESCRLHLSDELTRNLCLGELDRAHAVEDTQETLRAGPVRGVQGVEGRELLVGLAGEQASYALGPMLAQGPDDLGPLVFGDLLPELEPYPHRSPPLRLHILSSGEVVHEKQETEPILVGSLVAAHGWELGRRAEQPLDQTGAIVLREPGGGERARLRR